MALYTVVDNDYCVKVYTTQKALIAMIYRAGLLLVEPRNGEERKKPTIYAIRKAVSEMESALYLYGAEDGIDKIYKAEIQNVVNIGSR